MRALTLLRNLGRVVAYLLGTVASCVLWLAQRALGQPAPFTRLRADLRPMPARPEREPATAERPAVHDRPSAGQTPRSQICDSKYRKFRIAGRTVEGRSFDMDEIADLDERSF